MKPMKKSLSKAFKIAAASATLFVAGAYNAQAEPPASSVGRALTAGELQMNVIFGSEVDSSHIRLHAGPSKGSVIAETYDQTMIAFFGHPYLSMDYSKDPSAVNYGSEIHEMTHIWQFQNGWTYTNGHCPGGYQYKLKAGSRFEDYCSESQAAMVEDYARRFLRPQGSVASNWYVSMCGYDTPEHDAMLRDIIETRFPNARRERERLHRSPIAPGAKTRPASEPACPLPKKNDKPDAKGDPSPDQPDGTDPDQPKPRKTGQPVYFCDKLDFTFTRMRGIAYKQGFTAWPGFEAKLDKRSPSCDMTVMGNTVLTLGQGDFGANGNITPASMSKLAETIVRFTPPRIVEQLRSNLPTLFNDLIEQKRAEKSALKHLGNKADAEKLLRNFQLQLVGDPSLPVDSRAFIQEKIRIVEDMISAFDGKKPAPRQPAGKPAPLGPVDGQPGDPQGGGEQGSGQKQGAGNAKPTPGRHRPCKAETQNPHRNHSWRPTRTSRTFSIKPLAASPRRKKHQP